MTIPFNSKRQKRNAQNHKEALTFCFVLIVQCSKVRDTSRSTETSNEITVLHHSSKLHRKHANLQTSRSAESGTFLQQSACSESTAGQSFPTIAGDSSASALISALLGSSNHELSCRQRSTGKLPSHQSALAGDCTFWPLPLLCRPSLSQQVVAYSQRRGTGWI